MPDTLLDWAKSVVDQKPEEKDDLLSWAKAAVAKRPIRTEKPATTGTYEIGVLDPKVRKALEEKQRQADLNKMTTGEIVAEAGKSLIHGIARGVSGLPKSAAIAAKNLEDWVSEQYGYAGRDQDAKDYITFKFGQAIDQFIDKHLPRDPRAREHFIAGILPEGIGSMAMFLGGGMTARAIAGPGLLSKVTPVAVTAGMGASQEAASAYEDAIRHDASEEDARLAASLAGIVGTSEAWPVSKIFKRWDKAAGGKLQDALRKGLLGATEEGLQEFFQTASGNKIAQEIYDKERKFTDGLASATGAGGIIGFMASAIASAAGAKLKSTRLPTPEELVQQPAEVQPERVGMELSPKARQDAATLLADMPDYAPPISREGMRNAAASLIEQNPDGAALLARVQRPTRADLESIGITERTNAQQRADFAAELRRQLAQTAIPQEGTVQPAGAISEEIGPEVPVEPEIAPGAKETALPSESEAHAPVKVGDRRMIGDIEFVAVKTGKKGEVKWQRVSPPKPVVGQEPEKPKRPRGRVGIRAAERAVLDIHSRNKDIITGEDPDAYVSDEDTVEQPRREGYTFSNTPEGKSHAKELKDRLPKHLHTKVRIAKVGEVVDGNDVMADIGTDAMAESMIRFAEGKGQPAIRATADFVEANPHMFSAEDLYAVQQYRMASASPETAAAAKGKKPEKVNTAELAEGDRFERAGEEYVVDEVLEEDGVVYIKDGVTLGVPDGAELVIDEGSLKKSGKKRQPRPVPEETEEEGDTSFNFGANVEPTQGGVPVDLFGNPQGYLTGQSQLFGTEEPTFQQPAMPQPTGPTMDADERKIRAQYTDEGTGQFDFAEDAQQQTARGEGPGALPDVVARSMRNSESSEDIGYWPNAEVARRIKKARGMKRPSILTKAAHVVVDAFHKMTRPQQHLSKKWGSANEFFRLLKDVGQRVSDETVRTVGAIVNSLSQEDYDVFSHALLVSNQLASLGRGEPLRFGFANEEEVEATKARIDAEVARRPAVQEALETRQNIVKQTVRQLVEFGLLPQEALGRATDYFHQQVTMHMEFARMQGGTTPQTVKRSFQKKRVKGDELEEKYDYNTAYIEAETAWLTDAGIELSKEKLLREFIRDVYDILPSLKTDAKNQNFTTAVGGPDVAARIYQLRDERANILAMEEIDSDARRALAAISEELAEIDPTYDARKKIAIGFRMMGLDGNEDIDGDGMTMREIGRVAKQTPPDDPGDREHPDHYKRMYIIGAKTILRGIADRNAIIKQLAGDKFVTWQDLVPDGYVDWQPEPGNYFYSAVTIPERIAEAIQRNELDGLNLTADQMRTVLAMGGPKRQFVLPQAIIDQLNETQKRAAKGPWAEFFKGGQSWWKVWQLFKPRTVIGYFLRNFTGDIDPVLGGAPGVLRYTKQAIGELHRYYRGDIAVSKDLKEARDLSVIGSSLTAQEIPDLKELAVFRDLYSSTFDPVGAPARAIEKYFDTVKKYNQFREDILRYSSYLYYKNAMRGGNNLKHYGAARSKVVKQLQRAHGTNVAAAHAARNLLGDYGDLTVFGNWLRAYAFPFWSWVEVNMKRYPRLAINAAEWSTLKGKGNPFAIGVYGGMAAMGIGGMYGAMWAWNNLYRRDEEDDLGTWDRQNPHINLGRNPDGTVRVFRNVGALGDALEWFGINTLLGLLPDYMDGQLTGSDIAKEMLKDPVNKVVQGLGPTIKLPVEGGFGINMFPDMFNLRAQDRDDAIANVLGIREEYREARGMVLRDGSRAKPHYLQRYVVGVTDPRQNAIHEMHALRQRFLEKNGKERPSIMGGSPFKPLREAAMNNDFEAFKEARAKYVDSGKTFDNFMASLNHLDPIAAKLNDADEKEFAENFLTERQKPKLKIARDYAAELKTTLWKWWNESSPEGMSDEQRKYLSNRAYNITERRTTKNRDRIDESLKLIRDTGLSYQEVRQLFDQAWLRRGHKKSSEAYRQRRDRLMVGLRR